MCFDNKLDLNEKIKFFKINCDFKNIPIKYFLIALFLINTGLKAQQTLDYFISKAVQNSPLLYENNNLGKINALEIQRLKSVYTQPKVDVTANYLFAPILSTDHNKTTLQINSSGASNYYGYDLGATNGGEYQALLNVAQPLFGNEKLKIASEQLQIANQINTNNQKLTQHDIEKIVTDQYLLCLQDTKQIQNLKNTIKLVDDQQKILKKLVENSIYNQSDLILLNIEYQNYTNLLASMQATYRSDLLELNTLCGIGDTDVIQLQNQELTLKSKVENSVFLESYRLDSLNITALQNTDELQYKPQINAYANTGLFALNIKDIPQRFGLSAGLNLTWNLFDGNQKKINQQKNLLLKENITYQKQYFELQNKVTLDKILNEIKSIDAQITSINAQQSNYDILLETYKKELASGQISILDFVTVLKNKVSLSGESHLLLTQKQSLINTYNYWNW
jgi:outer membrane protein TolC